MGGSGGGVGVGLEDVCQLDKSYFRLEMTLSWASHVMSRLSLRAQESKFRVWKRWY